jgi:SAM-dependent methyltransferase
MKQDEYGRMYALEETHWWYVGMRAITAAILGEPRPATRPLILDAGCGTGNNLKHFAPWSRPIGVDLSQDALHFCQKRGVAVAGANLLSLPFKEATFDLVTSFDVLYHRWVTDDRAAVRELVRVLRPGGRLLVRVPALKLLWGAHDEAVYSRHRYSRRELVRLLEDCGLIVEKATYCNSLLFPVLAGRRTLDRWANREGSDVESIPGPLNATFRSLLRIEAGWVRHFSFPVGASVMALGRKPGGTEAPRVESADGRKPDAR